ncbi:MAG: carbon monoxide dehydrogenase subunit G [Bacillota bacterium]
MQLAYRCDFAAPAEIVWQVLLDPAVLARRLPGCKRLEPLGGGIYEAQLEIGIGPVKGSYTGRVQLADLSPPRSYRLLVEGGGGPSYVKGEGRIELSPNGEATVMTCTGEAAVSGILAAVGQRLLSSAARVLIASFFDGMAQEVIARRDAASGRGSVASV